MKEIISALFLESSQDSNLGIKNKLDESDFFVVPFSKVNTDDLDVLLKAHKWDLIIVDLDENEVNLQRTLEVLDQQNIITPLLVTGTHISQDTLYKAMKEGVQDYVLKNDLDRLIPVVTKEMRSLKKHREYSYKANQNKLFNQIIEKSSNEVFLMDPMTLKMVYANDTLQDNLGYVENEIYNLPAKKLIANYDISTVFETVAPLYRGEKKSTTFQFDRKRKDGSTYPVEIHLEVTHEETRQLLMGISFDISRQVEDAATIRKQRKKTKKLELSNKHKSEFYANLSHEMRTILNSNLLLTDILKDNRKGNLETDEIEYLEAIYQSSNSMLELLNAALDLSKIESGNISVQIKEFNISDICRSTEKLYKPIAREKGIDYQCFIDDHMASTIATDRLRLDQVLNNLISNALKFTKEGHVHLHIYEPDEKELKKRGIKDDNSIAFKISDTGIGIPKNRQKQIFKSYVQAEGISTKKRFGGTGLGLSISKEIAEILGGGIFLESEPEVGSTFTLIIPKDSHNALGEQAQKGRVKITEPESVADSDSLTEKKNSKKLKGTALLVDDSSIHNMALKEFLGFKISKCLTAETAEEAYATLHSHSVDCIILDMYLPDADGKEVLKELKSKKEFEHIPVIIYSGKNLSSSEEAELNKLAYSVVQKNVKSYNLLLDHITKIISKK